VNDKWEECGKAVVMACFKFLSRSFSGKTEENDIKPVRTDNAYQKI
jgi:hypothetical protein